MSYKKGNEKNIKNSFSGLMAGLAERLFHNESKAEQAIFICAILLSAAMCVLNIVSAFVKVSILEIILSLTVGIAFFLLTALLPVSDRFFVYKNKSLVLIAFSTACIVYAATGFFGASGVALALAILNLISSLALYGTLIYDQFVIDDQPFKYWLIYCGALYRVIYAVVMLIINGIKAGSVAGTLAVIFSGLASIAVIAMLLYLFDGFSFAKYMYLEIIDAGNDDDIYNDGKAGKDGQVKDGAEPSVDADEKSAIKSVETTVDDEPDENEEYIPYTEEASTPAPDIATKAAEPDHEVAEAEEPTETEPKVAEAEEPTEAEPEVTEPSEPTEAEPEVTEPSEPTEAEPEVTEAAEPTEAEPEVTEVSESTEAEPEITELAEPTESEPEVTESAEPTEAEPVLENVEEPAAQKAHQEVREDSADEIIDDSEFIPYDDGVVQSVSEKETEQINDEKLTEDAKTEISENEHEGTDAETSEDVYRTASENVSLDHISPTELKYVRFAAAHNKPDDTLQVVGMSEDLFDIWVDGDTICFLNDLDQAIEGRGVRTAVIPFGDVSGFRFEKLDDDTECVVLSYMKSDETREIRFTKESFVNFKRVMEAAGAEQ